MLKLQSGWNEPDAVCLQDLWVGWWHRFWPLVLMASVFLVFPLKVQAAGLVSEQSWYEDKSGQLNLESVRGQSLLPFDKVVTQRFGDGALWIRLRVDPQARAQDEAFDPAETLAVVVGPNALNQIELFDPLQPELGLRVAGQSQAWSDREYLTLRPAFRIPMGEEARDVWLRIQSEGTRRVEVEVLTLVEARRYEILLHAAFSAYLAVSVLFLGYAVIQWSLSPDRLVLSFAVRQATGMMLVFTAMGYARVALDGWISAQWIGLVSTWLLFLYVLAAVWFEYLFFLEMHPPRWARILMRCIVAVVISELALLVVGQVQLALKMLILTTAVLPVLGVAIVFKTRKLAEVVPLLPWSWLLWTYVIRAALNLIPALGFVGLMSVALSPLTSLMLQQLLVGALMVAVLYLRARRQSLARAKTLTQLAIERNHVLHERAHREDQQKLLAMLAHELKTPLSAMKMLVSLRTAPPDANATLHRMLADMNGVIERCLQSVRADDPAPVLHQRTVDVPVMLRLALARTLSPHRVGITCPAPLTWHTDPQVIQMVISNLLDNAIKYSPADTPVDLGVVLIDGPTRVLRLWVENEEGPAGVPDPAQVFKKYYRNPLARRQSGSGLGLYLTNSFVMALGGRICCRAFDGRVRFELCLTS